MIALRKKQFLVGTVAVAVIVLFCLIPILREYLRWSNGKIEAETRFDQITIGMELKDARAILGEGQFSVGSPIDGNAPAVKGTTFYCWESDYFHEVWVRIEGSTIVEKWQRPPSL